MAKLLMASFLIAPIWLAVSELTAVSSSEPMLVALIAPIWAVVRLASCVPVSSLSIRPLTAPTWATVSAFSWVAVRACVLVVSRVSSMVADSADNRLVDMEAAWVPSI